MKRVAFMVLAALAISRVAVADPEVSRVLTAPTAWLPPEGAAYGMAGTDHRGQGTVIVGYGLGGLAAVELGTDTDVRGCTACTSDARPDPLWLGRAAFRLGAHQDAWFAGMPAVVFGVRATFAAHGHEFGGARVGQAYVVASRDLGIVRLHAGALALDGGFGTTSLGTKLRPIGGLELRPPQYPKSTLMVDLSYEPLFQPTKVSLEWVAGVGARYQALTWGSIELGVRFRQDEGLSDISALARVNGVWTR